MSHLAEASLLLRCSLISLQCTRSLLSAQYCMRASCWHRQCACRTHVVCNDPYFQAEDVTVLAAPESDPEWMLGAQVTDDGR